MSMDRINIKIKLLLSEAAKKILIKILFPWRNRFILFNIFNKAKNNRVNLDYWNESHNLGDTLSPIIVNYLLKKKGIPFDKHVNRTVHLYAVGSVLTAGIQDATVWGSGILNSTITYRLENRKLDIRAVRGPFTKAILEDYGYDVPNVFGDPAILMPEIYKPQKYNKKYKYGLVLHKDYITQNIKNYYKFNIKVFNIKTDDYKNFIDELVSVEIVISSSLHGIILAEAYGIPAILLKPQTDMLKYYDYYFGTERYKFPVAESIVEAMKIKPAGLPELTKYIDMIKTSFPYDIYL